VQCHIGPGAPWFVKSKMSGLRQVYAVTFNTHSRPIPSPVHDLRPARDTCEQCHWPEKFHGDIISEIREYATDEANTESTTVLRVRVGEAPHEPGHGDRRAPDVKHLRRRVAEVDQHLVHGALWP